MSLSDHEVRKLDQFYAEHGRLPNQQPSRLTMECECGGTCGYGIDHDCDWTAHDPDEVSCEECGKYRGCACACESCGQDVKDCRCYDGPELGYVPARGE